MSNNADTLDDDYVAKLLAADAKKSSFKYASIGLQALLPKRPSNNAPKPNTRFLKNIIRETDSHNAALKRKEDREAQAQLRRVRDREVRETSLDASSSTRPSKRRRLADEGDLDRRLRHERRGGHSRRNTSSPESEDRAFTRYRSRPHHGARHRTPSEDEATRGGRPHRHSRDTKRSQQGGHRGREEPPATSTSRRRKRRSRSRSPTSDVQRSSRERRSKRSTGDDKETKEVSATISTQNSTASNIDYPNEESDSDPLEMLVGPLPAKIKDTATNDPPPLRSRGRGAYRPSASAMDAHFSSNYDPNRDFHPDSEAEDEKEDWDMALEALRDREAWKRKHAARLREAGFGDAEIKKWEDSGKEKTAADVKWSQKGLAREWDVGKVVEDEEPQPKKDKSRLESAWSRKDNGFLKGFKQALG